MANVGYQVAAQEMQEVEATARTMGLDIAKSEIRRAEDIAPAFDLLKGRVDALFVVTEPLAASHRTQNRYPGGGRSPADDARYARVRRSGRSNVLWTKLRGPIPASRRLG